MSDTTSITSAGVASGIDFESIIEALVDAKESSLIDPLQDKWDDLYIEISGVATLKEALETFQEAIEDVTEDDAFNELKVTTDEDDVNVFDIEVEDDASVVDFSIAVVQLADSESMKKTLDTDENSFEAGTITFNLGTDEEGNEMTFTVTVNEGDTLETIRNRINQNDYGVSATIITTDEGYVLSIDTGQTGADSEALTITVTSASDEEEDTEETDSDDSEDSDEEETTYTSLSFFAKSGKDGDDGNNGWEVEDATDAIAYIDGLKVTSDSNTFEDTVSGLTITVNAVSELAEEGEDGVEFTDADGNTYTYKAYTASIENDSEAVADKVSAFVDAYNDLMETLEGLYSRNTYTDGESNEDGGDLAGDATVSTIMNRLLNMVSSYSASASGKTIFDMGITFESDGTLSFDEDDFIEALETSMNAVTTLFVGNDDDDGLLTQLYDYLEEYTKTAGILDERTDALETEQNEVDTDIDAAETFMENYEENLRAKYTAVDILIADYNTSLSYLTAIL